MESLRELYRVGVGPSSSHTMGPRFAAEKFLDKYPNAKKFRVTLFESLAATGKGHLTDWAVLSVLSSDRTEIVWKAEECMPEHPNGMLFEALDASGDCFGSWKVYSVGGGAIREEGVSAISASPVYDLTTIESIMAYCEDKGITYWEYVEQREGPEIWDFLREIWRVMEESLERGIEEEGVLPGSIGLRRQAKAYYRKTRLAGPDMQFTGMTTAYALAVSEENAAGGVIVTAPTCGSCGIVPAALKYLQDIHNHKENDILRALATAGLFGNVIKVNASISGAEVGCQGEVGSACAMASAAATQLMGGTLRQIEYAAEMGLEHHLGLTCDPVDGLVQIPCIERNACAATRALARAQMSILSDGSHRIPFDEVVSVMRETGHDLPSLYRETSGGGLAKAYTARNKCSA
ncbi:L-serine ammonia-lyase [Maridesulfovibrio zosterae]|uniref:L-serine ammonia-lyase n=1 Tax=Maridesulfovibrio zosterae TaxID=82171 RepID=UPI00048612D8|nr:L-serine ammonia-lyase [Maridesulfovibrio zosterae]